MCVSVLNMRSSAHRARSLLWTWFIFNFFLVIICYYIWPMYVSVSNMSTSAHRALPLLWPWFIFIFFVIISYCICPIYISVLNMSTSAQLAFQMHEGFHPVKPETVSSIEYFPYFHGRYLAVAASLTGGNVMAAFVKMLQQWTHELGKNEWMNKRMSEWMSGVLGYDSALVQGSRYTLNLH